MRNRIAQWSATHLGYRRYVLACFGIATLAFGFNVPFESERWVPDEAVLFLWLPVPVRMALWFATGLAAIVIPYLWDRHERWGWWAAVVMPFERAMSFAISALMWIIPGAPGGSVRSLPSMVIWVCVTVILMRCATWPEASPERLARTRESTH